MQADFEGFYARFDTYSKKDSGILMGADTLVGNEFTVEFENSDEGFKTKIINRFGKAIGYFNESTSRQLKLLEARGWKTRIYLAFLAYSDHPEPGCYWGQMAILSYPAECDELFAKFCEKVSKSLGEGKRIDVNIGVQGVKNIVESNGEWFTTTTLPPVEFDQGTVMMKDSLSASEKLVEQGRAKNKGCYVISYAFMAACVGLLIFALHSCGVF